jgi:hypothetical protein
MPETSRVHHALGPAPSWSTLIVGTLALAGMLVLAAVVQRAVAPSPASAAPAARN